MGGTWPGLRPAGAPLSPRCGHALPGQARGPRAETKGRPGPFLADAGESLGRPVVTATVWLPNTGSGRWFLRSDLRELPSFRAPFFPSSLLSVLPLTH